MSFKDHLTESLRFEKAPSPWPRMILSASSVSLPLIAGLFKNDHVSSVYGALLAFILILNDHFGPLKRRIQHLFASFFFLAIAFLCGLVIADYFWVLLFLLFVMGFFLGKAKGFGIELERLLLFSTFQLLYASQTPELRVHTSRLFLYASLSFVNYLICLSLVYLIMRHSPNFQKSKRRELLEAFQKKESHRYAVTLAAVSCTGLLLAEFLSIEKGHWMVGTILIVMMPSRALSYQKSFQRVFGTFIGVLLAAIAITFGNDPVALILFSGIAAFLAPLGLIKNYWLGNVFIAALIMFFLELASSGVPHDQFVFARERIIDISIGCIIGAIGTLFAFPHRR